MNDTANQLRDLFDELCELDPAAQASRLGAIEDTKLRSELTHLLEVDASDSEMLSPDWLAELILPASEQVGLRVGAFELIRLLGSGGMGDVYLGRRVDGAFEQEAAIKLVRRDLATAEAASRFGSERQILARLNHPNIARLFDGGVTGDGRPYLIMELVDGLPIDEYCYEAGLDVPAMLRLFVRACKAAAHAHANLVVHCDLKPENILVTADGELKLLDFGIATALSGGNGESGPRAMTPDYAAPELFDGASVSTQADVYSLGVILYELLAGSLPIELDGLSPKQKRDRVNTVEPPPPSVRAGSERSISGDLDAICRRALAKNPAERYASPLELADDVVRALEHRAVIARDGGLGYLASRFVRRHAFAVAISGVAVLIIVALSVVYTTRLASERDQARLEANRAAATSRALAGVFTAVDPSVAKGEPISPAALIRRGRLHVETELADDPRSRAELLVVLGRVGFNLGLYSDAQAAFEAALTIEQARASRSERLADIHARLAGAKREQTDLDGAESSIRTAIEMRRGLHGVRDLGTASALLELASIQTDRGDYADALATAKRVLALQTELGAKNDAIADTHQAIAGASVERGDYAAAEASYRLAYDIGRRARGDLDPRTVSSLSDLAYSIRKQGRLGEAEPLYRQALALREKLFEGDHADTAYNLNHLGRLLFVKGELDLAEPFLRRGLAMRRRLYGSNHAAVTASLGSLSKLLVSRGDPDSAEEMARESVAINVSLYGDHHLYVAGSRGNLAQILHRRGELAPAITEYRLASEIARRTMEADNPRLGKILLGLGEALCEDKQMKEGASLIGESQAILAAKLPDTHESRKQAAAAAARCR